MSANTTQLPDLIVLASPPRQQPAAQPAAPAQLAPAAPTAPAAPAVAYQLPGQVPVYVTTEYNPTGLTLPKIKWPEIFKKLSSSGNAMPQPLPPQYVGTTPRAWKRADLYYSTDGPFPNGNNSGVIVYFDPSHFQ